VFGRVVGVHVRDELLVDHPTQPGRKRIAAVQAGLLARLAGTYARIDHEFSCVAGGTHT
jgi:hypothetical protein